MTREGKHESLRWRAFALIQILNDAVFYTL